MGLIVNGALQHFYMNLVFFCGFGVDRGGGCDTPHENALVTSLFIINYTMRLNGKTFLFRLKELDGSFAKKYEQFILYGADSPDKVS